jgi:hypothetical protein
MTALADSTAVRQHRRAHSGPGDPGAGPAAVCGPAGSAGRSAVVRDRGRTVRSWPLLLLAFPAAAEVWSGWVGIAQKTGFGLVSPLPGIWSSLHLDTTITLPVGVEAYAAYALRAWLATDPWISLRTRRFAKWSAICSFGLGMAGQVAYHLLVQAGQTRAPWGITTVVSCLPVLVLAMGTALAHMLRGDAPAQGARDGRPARPAGERSSGWSAADQPADQPGQDHGTRTTSRTSRSARTGEPARSPGPATPPSPAGHPVGDLSFGIWIAPDRQPPGVHGGELAEGMADKACEVHDIVTSGRDSCDDPLGSVGIFGPVQVWPCRVQRLARLLARATRLDNPQASERCQFRQVTRIHTVDLDPRVTEQRTLHFFYRQPLRHISVQISCHRVVETAADGNVREWFAAASAVQANQRALSHLMGSFSHGRQLWRGTVDPMYGRWRMQHEGGDTRHCGTRRVSGPIRRRLLLFTMPPR